MSVPSFLVTGWTSVFSVYIYFHEYWWSCNVYYLTLSAMLSCTNYRKLHLKFPFVKKDQDDPSEGNCTEFFLNWK